MLEIFLITFINCIFKGIWWEEEEEKEKEEEGSEDYPVSLHADVWEERRRERERKRFAIWCIKSELKIIADVIYKNAVDRGEAHEIVY